MKKWFESLKRAFTKKQEHTMHEHDMNHAQQSYWKNKMRSVQKKMSQGAQNIVRMIKTRAPWGRKQNKDHHKAP